MIPIYFVLVWLLSWGTGFISVLNNKDAYARWNGLLCFTGGSYSLSCAIQLYMVPGILRMGWEVPNLLSILNTASVGFLLFYWYFIAYSFLMNTLNFSNFLHERLVKIMSALLLLPPVFQFVSSGQFDFVVPTVINPMDSKWISGIYILAGCLLLFIGYGKDYNQRNPRRLFYVLIYVATIIAAYYDMVTIQSVTVNTAQFLVVADGVWERHYLIFTLLILVTVLNGVVVGIWGIKLQIENQKYDSSMKTLSAGAEILNHTIKNEVQKLNYLQERAKQLLDRDDKAQVHRMLDEIHTISDHLDGMVKRVKERAEDIVLIESEASLGALLDFACSKWLSIEKDRIQIVKNLQVNGQLTCDVLHVREVLHNIGLNAIEAMHEQEGKLQITTYLLKKDLIIEVKDNGMGIPKEQIERIFDPYFTTKKYSTNYGLGLSYCFNVMKKHGGMIGIVDSEPGKGTTLFLRFPAKRFKNLIG